MTCYNSELPIGPPGPVGPQGPPGPAGSGSGSSLAATLFIGNDTGGRDINLTSEDSIIVANGSKLKKGTIDNDFGGGISLICSNEKEQQWENGVRYLRVVNGTNVYAETLDNIAPNSTYNSTKNWATGSRFKNLVTSIEYICTNGGIGEWLPLSGTWTPTFDSGTTGMNNVTPVRAFYSIQGNICTCSVTFTCDLDFTSVNDGTVEISTPIPISGTLRMIGSGALKDRKQANIIVESNIITLYTDASGWTLADAEIFINYQFEIT